MPSTTAPLLRQPDFVRFWCAGVCTSFAFQMLSVSVAWQVYAITGSAFHLGLIGLAQFLPSLLLALTAGHVVDQVDRRRLVIVAQSAIAVAIAALAALAAADRLGEIGILMGVFAIGIAMAFAWPARSAMLPSLVDTPNLPRAMALWSSGGEMATIVGPAVGGFLYAWGPDAVYGTCAVLYAVSVFLVWRVRARQPPIVRERPTLATVFAGVRFIRRNPDLLGVISLDLFAVLLGGATALLPIFAKEVLDTGPVGLGLLRAAPAVGALAMSLWLARHGVRRRVGPIMFASVAGFGLATLVFALSTTMWLSLIALAALGAFDMISVVIRTALVQLDTPDAMRGRVNAVNGIFINTSNQLGEFESGMLAAWMGAVPAVAIGGIGTLVVVALWMKLFPTLRRRESL